MNPIMNPLVKEFGKWWAEQVANGSASDMDRLERMAIEIFVDWLLDTYEVKKKESVKE